MQPLVALVQEHIDQEGCDPCSDRYAQREDAERSAPEQAYVAELLRSTPLLARLTETVRAFCSLLNERRVGDLEAWLQQATASGVAELAAFAEGVRRDLAAVQAALTLRWSQGQTEGQINRLKLLKRQMYGRANLDLLRQRVRYRAAS